MEKVFPLFTLLEDLSYLARIAFNLDNFFKKACACRKQALTMCMGFGCNAADMVIWVLANISINNISLLTYSANFLNPFADFLGLDGYILMAFILGFPANEM